MNLKSKILVSFSLVVCILVFTGGINIFFFLRINKDIDELVENRFAIEQKIQSGHLIINKIYNRIWDTLMEEIGNRQPRILELDELATDFYRAMDTVSGSLSVPAGALRDQKRFFQTFYIVGKDLLLTNTLADFQENREKLVRFKTYKDRLTRQIDTRFQGYKDEFAASLSDLQRDAYIIAAFSTLAVVFGAFAAVIISIKLSAGLVAPILDLTHVVKQFRAGRKGILADEGAAGEIGRLGAAFNRMTHQLNASVESLEAQIVQTRQAREKADQRRRQLVQADKMASLGILVSGVAHEINNPNQFIMAHIAPLKKAWDGAIPVLDRYFEQYGDFRMGGTNYSVIKEKIPTIFANVSKGSQRIKSIVDELRNFASEQPKDAFSSVDLNAVVDASLMLTANMVKKSAQGFTFDRDPDLPQVFGHYQRLEQVVVNLVQNACQALKPGRGTVSVHTGYILSTDQVSLAVTDTGKGIDPKNLAHVTDPFFTTRRETGGTGLGLSVSSRIIADHGGSMVFESKPGEGTTVIVHLPCLPHKPAATEQPRKGRAR